MYYGQSASKRLLFPTDVTPDLITVALELLDTVYRSGCRYKRAGIMLTALQPNSVLQLGLFEGYSVEQAAKSARLMAVLDVINAFSGRDTLFFGAQGLQRAWLVESTIAFSGLYHEMVRTFDRSLMPETGTMKATRKANRGRGRKYG